jgi:hypothetical protein
VAETYNTISNVGFVAGAIVCALALAGREAAHGSRHFDLYRPLEGPLPPATLWQLIHLMFWCGICSGMHHALCDRWGGATIVLDWVPIVNSICVLMSHLPRLSACWTALTPISPILILFALAVLAEDHLSRHIPPPWGHVAWHLAASIALTSTYLDLIAALQ